jgi:hypothetical protein
MGDYFRRVCRTRFQVQANKAQPIGLFSSPLLRPLAIPEDEGKILLQNAGKLQAVHNRNITGSPVQN